MKIPKTKTIQTIVLLDVLRYLQYQECTELGIEYNKYTDHFTLPDGTTNIYDRVWNLVRDSYHGNQQFCNDSYHICVFDCEEERSSDEQKLYEVCKGALNVYSEEQDFEMVVFEVCW
jgi:site-specific DNA-adenine methylase